MMSVDLVAAYSGILSISAPEEQTYETFIGSRYIPYLDNDTDDFSEVGETLLSFINLNYKIKGVLELVKKAFGIESQLNSVQKKFLEKYGFDYNRTIGRFKASDIAMKLFDELEIKPLQSPSKFYYKSVAITPFAPYIERNEGIDKWHIAIEYPKKHSFSQVTYNHRQLALMFIKYAKEGEDFPEEGYVEMAKISIWY